MHMHMHMHMHMRMVRARVCVLCMCACVHVCMCACATWKDAHTHICRRWKASAHVKINRNRKPGEMLTELEARSAQRYIYR